MEYKGYLATVELDEDAGILHGSVANTRDVITFEAENPSELVQAFHDSVEDYLDFCSERGEEPERPFSGVLNLRMGSELHKEAFLHAMEAQMSLNSWLVIQLKHVVEQARVAQEHSQHRISRVREKVH